MNVVTQRSVSGLALLAFLLLGNPALAEPVALVLEKVGPSTPEVEPFTEILSPLEIALPANSTLVFFHYPTCHTVELVGGTVQFSEETYEVLKGTKDVITEGPCPLQVRCSEDRGCETAALVLRGLEADPSQTEGSSLHSIHLSPLPTFILVGKRASEFETVRVSQGPHVVLEEPLHGQQFQWPVGTAPLVEGTEYELTFIPKPVVADPFHVTLTVAIPTEDALRDEVVLLRID